MKILLLRCTLAILMCGMSASAWADEYIINEDFSEMPNTYPDSYNGWTLYGCIAGLNVSWSNHALRIENKNSTKTGYASSPQLTRENINSWEGDVLLSFDYARGGSNNNYIFNLEILKSGIFKDKRNINSIRTLSDQSSFSSISIAIIDATQETSFKFSEAELGKTFAIDNVKVSLVPLTSLSESFDNSTTISDNDTKKMTVNTTRTLTGGIWNTMCLPFDVTMDDLVLALGDNQDIRLRTYSSYDTTQRIMYFEEVDNNATIIAGTPFLIKLNTTVVNPTFHVVTIKNTAASSVTHNSVSFVGTYSPVDLNIDGTHLFITTDGTVAKPGDDTQNHLKGLRAYIEVPSGTTTPSRLNIDDETVDIQQIDADDDYSTALYDLKGLRLERPKKGLCIKDGKLIFIK